MTFFRKTSMRVSPVFVACACVSVSAGTAWIQNKRAGAETSENEISKNSVLTPGKILSSAAYCDGLISLSRHHTSPSASYSRSTKPIKCRDGTSVFPWSAPPREEHLKNLREKRFDVLVIGGGCVGNGVALDAITRGLSVAVVERDDFAAGTSGRSTKLIHGGVRYLEAAVKNLDIGQYNLVKEALTERAHMLNSCPYIARALPIMIPLEHWWQVPMMWFGTKLYDFVAGSSLTVPPSMFMNKAQAHYVFPMLRTHNIYGAVVYYDGQMNDTRFALLIALTAAQAGATIANHVNVEDLIVGKIKKTDSSGVEKEEKVIRGAVVRDVMTGELIKVRAKTVVNCTGPFTDTLRKRAYELAGEEKSTETLLVEPVPEKTNSFFSSLTSSTPKRYLDDWDHDIVVPAGGIHVMLPDHFSPANMGLIVPETKDGRVLFFLPWEGGTLCGTTDSKSPVTMLPKATSQEVDFVLAESSRYLNKKVQRSDVLAAWSGIRPLVKDPKIMAAEKKRREEEEKQKVLESKRSIDKDIKILNLSQTSSDSPNEKDAASYSTKDEKKFAVALENNNGKTNAAENELLQQKALKKGVDKTRDDTKSISREHVVEVNDGKMVTVVGGKWTTYRQMAEDAMDKVLKVHPDLASKATPCVTKNMMLIGSDRAHIVCDQSFDQIRVTLRENYGFDRDIAEHLTRNYGTRALQIAEIVRHGYVGREKHLHPKRLHPKYPFIEAELVFAVEQEYALTVEDFLARRIRLAFVDEKAARQVLPHAVELMAKLLNWNSKMKKVQFERASEFLNTMNVKFDDDAEDQEVE